MIEVEAAWFLIFCALSSAVSLWACMAYATACEKERDEEAVENAQRRFKDLQTSVRKLESSK